MVTVGALCLAVLAAVRGSTGYRLEGQIFDGEEEPNSLSESSAEIAFSASSDHGKDKAQEATDDEECDLAVSGSKRKRRNKCECPEGWQVKCSGEPCNAHGDTFAPKAFAEKSCSCVQCDTSCEAVPGAKTRGSQWKRVTGRDCMCEKGLFLAGSDANCEGKGRKDRYFKSKLVIDRGCFCSVDGSEEQDSNGGERALPQSGAPVAEQDQEATAVKDNQKQQAEEGSPKKQQLQQQKDDEEPAGPVTWYKRPEVREKVIYGLCGVVIAGLFITTICRVFKISGEDEHEHAGQGEDASRAGSEAAASRAGSETGAPQDAGARSAANGPGGSSY